MSTTEETKPATQFWREQITEWEQSGQSQKSFCEEHDLSYHRFGYWRRKYLERDSVNVQQGNGFVPVRHSVDGVSAGLTLMLPNGMRIQGIESGNLPVVSQLLRQL